MRVPPGVAAVRRLPAPLRGLAGVLRSVGIYYRPDRRGALDRMHARFGASGDLAFDIGSHVGDRVASFRRLGMRVVAVEPQPLLARLLRLFYGLDPQVSVVEAAVGEAPGSCRMHLNLDNPTVSTASVDFIRAAGTDRAWHGQQWEQEVHVPVTTLDELIRRFGHPRFIKIDVEGYEDRVLQGLSRAPAALSFEFTTIQRPVARAALVQCRRLGLHRFNAALGESQRLLHPAWMQADGIRAWLDALPPNANSGDIYALRG